MEEAIKRQIDALEGSENADFQELHEDAMRVPAEERYLPSLLNLNIACLTGNVTLVREMLADDRVSPQYLWQEKYYWMAYGWPEIVRALLEDERFDPCDNDSYPFFTVCTYGWSDSLRLLLEDGRVHPNIERDDVPIVEAAAGGHLDAVRLLLEDGRANPAARENFCIAVAAERGYEKIVALLMRDGRVNASDNHNEAMKEAIAGKHWGVVRLLTNDRRVMRSLEEGERYIAEKVQKKY